MFVIPGSEKLSPTGKFILGGVYDKSEKEPRSLVGLTEQINEFTKKGYSPQSIVAGIIKSNNPAYKDIQEQIRSSGKFHSPGGQLYFAEKILTDIKKQESREWAKLNIPIAATYQEEVEQGLIAMKDMVKDTTFRNFFKGIFGGALRYTLAPITAIAKGVVGETLERVLRTGNVPEPVTQFIGEMGENAVYILPYAQMVQKAMKTGQLAEGYKAAQAAGKIGKETVEKGVKGFPKPPLQFPTKPSPEQIAKMQATGEKLKPVLHGDLQKTVVDHLLAYVKSPLKEDKRIGQHVIDLIDDGSLIIDPKVMAKYNTNPQELAMLLKDAYSTAGRTLGKLGWTVKRLKKQFKDNPKALKYLDEIGKQVPGPDSKIIRGLYSLESTRRAFLVGQLKTTMRNIETQAIRTTVGSLDDALQGAIEGSIGMKGNTWQRMGRGLDNFIAMIHRFKPQDRKRLAKILDSDDFIRERLLHTTVHEVNLGSKVANVVNTGNTFQERFFRKLAFEGKLTQLLREAGKNYKTIDTGKIPKGFMNQSVDYALDITFAAMPKSQFAQKFVRDWASYPLMTILFNPFPRFAFGNALPFITRFSPLGFIKAFKPRVVADLAGGNPEKFAKAASEATIGSLFLNTAMHIRDSKLGGEKWYELNINDKSIDTRSFAPLSSYLFIAEAIMRPEKLKASDFLQATIGLNRIAGTGLVITDIARSKKFETTADTLKKIVGQWAGSFAVPIRTAKDFYTYFDKEEAYIRDTYEHPLIAPLVSNIPELSQVLPKVFTPTRKEPLKTERPIFSQVTGLQVKIKNEVEKEIDRLTIDKSRIYPRTGIPEADRRLSELMGRHPFMKHMHKVFSSKFYQNLPDPLKKASIAFMFMQMEQDARVRLAQQDLGLYGRVRLKGIVKSDIKELFKLYKVDINEIMDIVRAKRLK